MKMCRFAIYLILAACLIGLSLGSCVADAAGASDSVQALTRAAATVSEPVMGESGMPERVPVPYSNGKARALLDKFRADSLTQPDCLEAMEMLEQATEDVHSAMLEIVESATSQVEAVENIGDREREFKDKYRYLTQLRQMMQSLPESGMGADLHRRFTLWDRNVTEMFVNLEQRVKAKFPQPSCRPDSARTL